MSYDSKKRNQRKNNKKKASGFSMEPGVYTEGAKVPIIILRVLAAVYALLMFGLYPLYYQDKYFNMGEAKWIFFRNITAIFAVLFLGMLVWYLVESLDHIDKLFSKSNFIMTDYFAIGYMIVSIISTIVTPYKDHVIWGYNGWYMGLIAQICFVVIYFLISRLWRFNKYLVAIYLGAAFIVFFLGVIMRFRIDPLGMYEGLSEEYIRDFISTMGQTTWYSSYMCLLIPLGLIAYWMYDELKLKIVFGIFTAVSFMTMISQNSDSAIIAFAGIFFLLFWISMNDNRSLIRFFEIMAIAFGSFRLMGIMRTLAGDAAVPIGSLPETIMGSNATLVLAVICVAIVVGLKKLDEMGTLDVPKYTFIRNIVLGIVIAGIVGGIIYITLNSLGQLPESLSSDNNYLLFDTNWGNNRGSSWYFAFGTFLRGDIVRKLFGGGPDAFYDFVYTFFSQELHEKWSDGRVLTCAHNEWLNTLVNLGILGFVSYLGIFIAAFKRCMDNAKDYPELYGIAMAIIAYMGHNFFCYQQIICTPVIFMLIAMGESLIRYGRKYL